MAVHGNHCAWDLSGDFYSSIPGLKEFESTSFRCRGAERIGIVVDRMTSPVVRCFLHRQQTCLRPLYDEGIYLPVVLPVGLRLRDLRNYSNSKGLRG